MAELDFRASLYYLADIITPAGIDTGLAPAEFSASHAASRQLRFSPHSLQAARYFRHDFALFMPHDEAPHCAAAKGLLFSAALQRAGHAGSRFHDERQPAPSCQPASATPSLCAA